MGERDLTAISEFVNSNQEVRTLSFTGDEPTLQLDRITRLQGLITRPISYEMTTNGSWGLNPSRVLEQLLLDKIIISFDTFHSPFVRKNVVNRCISAAQKAGIEVKLTWVSTDLFDLSESHGLHLDNVQTIVEPLLNAGRARKTQRKFGIDRNALDESCPAVSTSHRKRSLYMPSRGLTPCCGPLLHDQLVEDNFLFSEIDSYGSNKLRNALKLGSFREQFSQRNLKVEDSWFAAACDACQCLYADYSEDQSKLTLALLPWEEPFKKTFRVSKRLPEAVEKVLTTNTCSVRYHLEGNVRLSDGETLSQSSVDLRLSEKSLEPGQIEEFFIRTFCDRFARHMDISSDKAAKQLSQICLNDCEKLYSHWLGEELVGLLTLNLSLSRRYMDQNVSFIPYLGIDPALPKILRSRIKLDWKILLKETGRPASGIIDSFNQASMAHAETMGREFSQVTLERKH